MTKYTKEIKLAIYHEWVMITEEAPTLAGNMGWSVEESSIWWT
ncbi:hypothetical protein ME790_03280 [Lactobacillus delbrueckii]|nr:hypothetical protein ME784_11240 [Lactobacillus delbrueckii]GHN22249.1 hypothetical protein ME785_08070 [Lactobacillus delbrueckii]GHN31257.1 hypothetical protein ME790_03280 [Lactobacillus delbrueckii]GHN62115.1 hypothetical protein ME807_05220 [Lactobacillus delbrueckii]